MDDPRQLDRLLHMTERFRASQEGIELAVQRVMAGLALFYLCVITYWSLEREPRATDSVLLIGVLVLLVVMAIRAWRTRLTIADVAASLGALAGSLFVQERASGEEVGIAGGPAFAFMTLSALLAAVVLGRRTFAAAIALIAVTYVGGHALQPGAEGWPTALDECVAYLSLIVASRLVLIAYRRSGSRADAAARTRFLIRQDDAVARAHTAAAAERRRFIHDDVIAALVTIQHSTSRAVSLRAATSALSALQRSPATQLATLTEIEWTPDADLTIDVDFDIDLDPSGGPSALPPMAAGVTPAIQEALRNVQRHSGTSKAHVRVATEDDVLTVTIRDDGRGFDPEQATGFGIKESIIARMTALGGTASIDSSPGRGTVVTLTWSDRTLTPQGHPLPSLRASIRRPLRFTAQVTAAATVGQVWLAARHLESSSPWQAALALAVLTVGLTGAVAVFAAKRALGAAHLVGIGILWCALLACGLALAPTGSLATYDTWMLDLSCVVIITVASFVSFRSVLALACSLTAVVALRVASDPDMVLVDATGALLQPITWAVAIGAVAAGCRSASVRASQLEAETGRAVLESAHAIARQAAAEEFDLRTEPELRIFLHQLATGRLDPEDQDVRDRARVLAIQTRDELYLPGVLDDDLRLLLATSRTAGARVTIHPSDHTRPNDHAARLLNASLDPSRVESATLTLPDHHSPLMRMVVMPELTSEHHRRLQGQLVDLDPDIEQLDFATVITIRVGHSHDWSATERPD